MSAREGGVGRTLQGMPDPSALDGFVDVLAERVAERVLARLAERDAERTSVLPSNALRMDEAGRRLGLSEREVQRQVLKGTIKSVKVGRVRLIPLSALDEFLAAQRAS